MNANAIISDDMTLDQKLAAIDEAMAQAVVNAQQTTAAAGVDAVQLDPADLLMCEGCQ